MGWDGTYTNMYKNGKVDVKRFLDNEFTWKSESGQENTVIKSAMVGSVYYAAISVKNHPQDGDSVFCAVCLTSTKRQDGCNIFWKSMTEYDGPINYDCPIGILKLLTPTDSEWAKNWRLKCYTKIEEKKREKTNPYSLKNLPVGSQICFPINFSTTSGLKPGDYVTLEKDEQTRFCWRNGERVGTTKQYWYDGYYRWPGKMIPADYKVVRVGKEVA